MKKVEFWILIVLYTLLALADGLLTYINTPDLSFEGNPLVTKLGLGWGALATVNIVVFILLFSISYYSFFKYKTIYTNETKFTAYCSQIINDRPDKFWSFAIPKHIAPFLASAGYAGLYGLILGRAVLVFEWLCITFDATWSDGYFYFRNTYLHGKFYVVVVMLITLFCMFFWLYKEYKKQLNKK